jgi:hypothetical protein
MEQSKIKKILAILLAILFVVSATAVAVDAIGHNVASASAKNSAHPAATITAKNSNMAGFASFSCTKSVI